MANHRFRTVIKGIDIVAQALDAEDFPMTIEEIDYAVGDIQVEDHDGKTFPIRDVMDKIDQKRFDSADEAVAAIERVLGIQGYVPEKVA